MMEEFSETIIKLQHIHTIKPEFSGPGFHFPQELGTVLYIKFLVTSDRQGRDSRDKIARLRLCAIDWIKICNRRLV